MIKEQNERTSSIPEKSPADAEFFKTFLTPEKRGFEESIRMRRLVNISLWLAAVVVSSVGSMLLADDAEMLPYYSTQGKPPLSGGQQFFAGVLPETNASEPAGMTASYNGEIMTLQEESPKQMEIVQKIKGPRTFKDFFTDSQGASYASWGGGMTEDMGVAMVKADGSVQPMVPIKFDKGIKGQSHSSGFTEKLKQGRFWCYTGPAACDQNGDFYLSLGTCVPNAIVKYDRETKEFTPKVRLDSCRGLNVYDFDSDAVFATSAFQIHRFEFSDSLGSDAAFKATSHLAIQGEQAEILMESQAIRSDIWLVSLLNADNETYRTLLIDLKSKSFCNLPQLDMHVRMGVSRTGDLICISGASVTTYKIGSIIR